VDEHVGWLICSCHFLKYKLMNNDIEILLTKVESTVNGLITKRKLKWMSDTSEFREGLLIGLELAGIYGKQISEIYKVENDMLIDDGTSDGTVVRDNPDTSETPSNNTK
jgi:hypothetical protein